eukprot:Nk52_evm24s271 gene=Nk52_evmTU24s271
MFRGVMERAEEEEAAVEEKKKKDEGEEENEKEEDKEEDVGDSLERELEELRSMKEGGGKSRRKAEGGAEGEGGGECHQKKKMRFLRTDDKSLQGMIFIAIVNDPKKIINPIALCDQLFEDYADSSRIATQLETVLKFTQRLLPITSSCFANLSDIKKHLPAVLCDVFHSERQPQQEEAAPVNANSNTSSSVRPSSVTYDILYRHRLNNQLKRDDLIPEVARCIDKSRGHKVDLKNAQYSIIVEVGKNRCYLSVVKEFKKRAKFNIRSIQSK